MAARRIIVITLVIALFVSLTTAQQTLVQLYDSTARQIVTEALGSNRSYEMLEDLCTTIGHRISGSPQAARAVEWAKL
jgi:hypothetical protein